MTQYLLAVHGTVDDPEPDMEALAPVFEAVARFNHQLREAGVWVFAGGLEPVDVATTVDGTGAEPVITDGRFAESKEWLAGFWIIEAADLDAALKWASEGSKACAAKVEVRPFQDDAG